MKNTDIKFYCITDIIQTTIHSMVIRDGKKLSGRKINSLSIIRLGPGQNTYLSTDYFGTRQIIFGNNMNTIGNHFFVPGPIVFMLLPNIICRVPK